MIRTSIRKSVRQVASTRMPTRWGTFQTLGYEWDVPDGSGCIETALALLIGNLDVDAPLVRIHSQCFTSEVLGSLRCDCNQQLDIAMRAIATEGRGLLIYEYQEGRGIGLTAKLQAYALQDGGLDTVESNHALGFKADFRDFLLPAAILHELGVRQVRLLSNNPHKSRVLFGAGIEVVSQIPCEAAASRHSLAYLQTKKERMGHSLNLRQVEGEFPVSYEPLGSARISADPSEWVPPVEPRSGSSFASIEDALAELKMGRMIVVVDDEDRENEGDLTMAAEMITPEAVNFMAMHGRGLICLAMTGERLDRLDLAPMVPCNTALHETAFTASIDLKGYGVTTGISAHDRAQTIRAAIDETSQPDDFGCPGHVFPLRARPGGVLERRGQTEAAVDLARLAGLKPAGVICEIVNDGA
jgi:3,4-dihydroxy-2-butanone 4-phosphate synthase/GTP cyclohydrolase II